MAFNWEHVLSGLCESILTQIHGAGYWRRHKKEDKPKPEDMLDVGLGDTVWIFNEDDGICDSYIVLVVHQQIPYVNWADKLWPVYKEDYSKSLKECVVKYKKNIESELKYQTKTKESNQKLLKQLAESGENV